MTNQKAIANEGHPRGLYTLFGTEAWERFSYYGMRALLVLYLVNQIKLDRRHALELYAVYTSLVYLTPLVGGILADKVLGRRKAVLIGGIVMALGQIALMFPPLLHLALGLLIAGNGFFKPNISTMVGGLYREGDSRRDGAFTIFYMGINLGALWSPIVCGTLGETIAYPLGFGFAALGMAVGLVQFAVGQKHLGRAGLPPSGSEARDYMSVALWAASTCALVWGILYSWNFLGPILGVMGWWFKAAAIGVAAGTILVQLFRGSTAQEAQQILVILILCIFNIFFWMGFEQAGGTMTLFADEQTERNVGGMGMLLIAAFVFACAYNFRRSTKSEASGVALWLALTGMFVALGVVALGLGAYNLITGSTTNIPASQFQAINPLVIVALAPTFSNVWSKLDSGKYRTTTPTKMALGMVLLGFGFLVLFIGQKLAVGAGAKASAAWLFSVYVIHTMGELCLSPIGLSMVTKLAPPRASSLAMGLWLGSSAVANYFAGTLESMLKQVHTPIYAFLVLSSMGPALLLVATTPLLKAWMHGKA
ncbi:MAG: peptide MFS transporter [Polyangiaceae bacterium]|nr:peptide MFS transporter [Polyangiaceae bacterium]